MRRRNFLLGMASASAIRCIPARASRCAITTSDIEGPYYRAGAPEGTSLGSAVGNAVPLRVEGRVRDSRCREIEAELDIWQADELGDYDLEGFAFRRRLRAEDGLYRFDTIHPGRYRAGREVRPAHIHVKVRARDGRELTTQLYFPDDPHNTRDPFFHPSRLVRFERRGESEVARFDFVLPG